jgi:hypothetical protein
MEALALSSFIGGALLYLSVFVFPHNYYTAVLFGGAIYFLSVTIYAICNSPRR